MTLKRMTMAIASSLSANNPAFGVFCNPESRRVEGFCAASAKLLRQYPALVPWQWVLENAPWPARLEPPPRWLRLESPGRNWTVEKAILLRGAAIEDEEATHGWARLSAPEIQVLEHDPGRVYPMRQWYLGWRSLLQQLSSWAAGSCFANRWLCSPEQVATMYDKAACQQLFERAGFPTPPALGIPAGFDELWEMMKRSGRRRIFLKPCHGSAATGIVALESHGNKLQAHSTLELAGEPGASRMYNHRQIRVHRSPAEVRRLVNEICRHRCIAQAWIPKAGLHGRPFDLRVVVIGGIAGHVMVRLGRGPMTNSQLLGGKGDVALLRSKMKSGAWERMLTSCERAFYECFPFSLYAAFDVLVEPDFQTIHFLEANAFGDLLPGLLYRGYTTYEWEVAMSRPTAGFCHGALCRINK
jgi:hypothetical protein